VRNAAFSRRDAATWDYGWSGTGLFTEGIIGYDPFFTAQALRNRQNPRLHRAYSLLYETEALLTNFDRYGFFRPTKHVQLGSGKHEDFPQWKTLTNLHLDMNPFAYVAEKDSKYQDEILARLKYKTMQDFITENNQVGVKADNQLHIQGLVNLADNKEEDGGFQIVPGFRHDLEDFVAQRAKDLRPMYSTRKVFCVLPDDEPLQSRAIRVSSRAGSAVLWDQRTVHGSRANDSSRPRFAQFLKFFPARYCAAERWAKRKDAVDAAVKKSGWNLRELTPLGRRVLCLEQWPADSAAPSAARVAAAPAAARGSETKS